MSLLLALFLTTPEPIKRPSDHEIQELLAEEHWGRLSSTGMRLHDVVIRGSLCYATPFTEAEKRPRPHPIAFSIAPDFAVECGYDVVFVGRKQGNLKGQPFYQLRKQRVLSRKEKREITEDQWQAQTRRFLFYSYNNCQYMGKVPAPGECKTTQVWNIVPAENPNVEGGVKSE
jgi:hypothetical protein